MAQRAVELGFTSTVGIIHDGDGQLQPLPEEEQHIFLRSEEWARASYARMNYFQDNIAARRTQPMACRAGARYLYICEDGLVHYCSQQRGYPATPLEQIHGGGHPARVHHREVLRAVLHGGLRPLISYIDFWRAPQRPQPVGQLEPGLVQIESAGD